LDERVGVGPPAERIIVDVLLLVDEQFTNRPLPGGNASVKVPSGATALRSVGPVPAANRPCSATSTP